MNDVLELLRLRRRDRDRDHLTQYWNTLVKIAGGLTERAAGAAAEELDRLATALARDPEQVEADLLAVRELAGLDAPAIAKARAAIPAEYAAVDRRIAAAEAAVDRAAAELEAARDARTPVASRAGALKASFERVRALRCQLEAAGCPPTVLGQLGLEASS